MRRFFAAVLVAVPIATCAIASEKDAFIGRVGALVAITKRCPDLVASVERIFSDAKSIGVSVEGPVDGLSADVAEQEAIWRAGLQAMGPEQACAMGEAMFGSEGSLNPGYVKRISPLQ